MRHRLPALIPCLLVALGGCSFVGESAVHVETGNQTTGFLTRPITLTTSSDQSVQEVAQRVCDGVKPGSVAAITFVGKVPGPGPINISDWGKYRYDCQPFVAAGARAPVSAGVPASAPAAAPASAAPATAAPAAPAGVSALTEAQEQHRRECQRKQGAYQVCVGSCLASSSSASGVVEGECAQRCAAQAPNGCN